MILKQNSAVKMAVAFPNCGCVISITIVAMILMNQPICVVNVIAQLDGSVVLVSPITDVFQNGCSVMPKTIVAMEAMSYQKIVPNVIRILISNVPIIDVFQSKFLCFFKYSLQIISQSNFPLN